MRPYAYPLGLKVLTASYYDTVAFETTFDAYIESFEDDYAPVLQVIVNEFVFNQGDPLNDLRPEEKQVSYYIDPVTDYASIAVHDLRKFTKTAAILSIVTTLAICIVLATGSLLLSKVTQDLVLSPIEDMMSKVKEITRNPIQAAQQAEEDAVKQEDEQRKLAK